ncbi:MAG TPA: N-acetyltransferase [Alphaproteobacteria bacterium]|nr:N-acetyltransferase [Alphaproteobacteria bacterium]
MVTIAAPAPEHAPLIEDLLDHAFGLDRRRKTSYRYRYGVAPVVSLSRVALSGEVLLGSIQFWPARLGSETVLLLGPIALWAGHVGQGVGSCLMRAALAAAKEDGWRFVFLVGDPAYYRRFGFQPASTWGVVMPGEDPDRFQGYCLTDAEPPAGNLFPVTALQDTRSIKKAKIPLV